MLQGTGVRKIVDALIDEGAVTPEAMIAALEDGEALAAIGITDTDRADVETLYNNLKGL